MQIAAYKDDNTSKSIEVNDSEVRVVINDVEKTFVKSQLKLATQFYNKG